MMLLNPYRFAPAGINWSNIYTYTTNATHATVTAWIGAAISTKPTLPNTLEALPVMANANSTFRANTQLTSVNIEDSVTFFTGGTNDTMVNCFNGCTGLTGVNAIPANVTNMVSTFRSCTNLVNAPIIPDNVTDMAYTFFGCGNLVNAQTIGANVTNMAYTFYGCSTLVNSPTIGANVTIMGSTFRSCTNLVNAPIIPDNVTNMGGTFRSCTNLAGDIIVQNTSVTNFTDCFKDCNASIAKTLKVPAGSDTYTLAMSVCDGKNGVTVVGV